MCVAVDKAFSKLILPRHDALPHLSLPQQQNCSQKKLIMRVVRTHRRRSRRPATEVGRSRGLGHARQ